MKDFDSRDYRGDDFKSSDYRSVKTSSRPAPKPESASVFGHGQPKSPTVSSFPETPRPLSPPPVAPTPKAPTAPLLRTRREAPFSPRKPENEKTPPPTIEGPAPPTPAKKPLAPRSLVVLIFAVPILVVVILLICRSPFWLLVTGAIIWSLYRKRR